MKSLFVFLAMMVVGCGGSSGSGDSGAPSDAGIVFVDAHATPTDARSCPPVWCQIGDASFSPSDAGR